jgi:hypothetical protein
VAGLERCADRVHARDEGAVGAEASSTALPMRVMIFMFTAT